MHSVVVIGNTCDDEQCGGVLCNRLTTGFQKMLDENKCLSFHQILNRSQFTPDSVFSKSVDFEGGVNGYSRHYDADEVNWWYNPAYSHAFEIYDLNLLYPDNYYQNDHVSPPIPANYVAVSLFICQMLRGNSCQSVLELGAASCFMTAEFRKKPDIEIYAVEGAAAGIHHCLNHGIPHSHLFHRDLRLPLVLNRRFDLALCTEVAEHIEPPFSSQLVLNLVMHSDVVFFSFEDRQRGNLNHIHHNNEQPEKFWTNLFAFYGYHFVKLPEHIVSLIEFRGGYIFYNKNTITVPPDAVDDNGVMIFAVTE